MLIQRGEEIIKKTVDPGQSDDEAKKVGQLLKDRTKLSSLQSKKLVKCHLSLATVFFSGIPVMDELEESFKIAKSFDSEFKSKTRGQQKVSELYEKLCGIVSQEPTSRDVALVFALLLGSDVWENYAHPPTTPDPNAPTVSQFYKFCQTELRLPKKNLPKQLVDRLDKLQKDRFLVYFFSY